MLFSIIQSTAIAQSDWKIYKLSHKDQVFNIPYAITNGTISSIEADPDFSSMIIALRSELNNDGTLEIALPRNLIDATRNYGADPDDFIVLVMERKQGTFRK
jgi:hypothetical protein